VIAISASGNSPNVLKAVDLANKIKARTIGFTGFDGGKLGPMVDLNIHVPSTIIEQVEDIHLMLEHLVVKTLKELACEPCPLAKDQIVDIGDMPADGMDSRREMNSSMELIQSLVQEVDLQGDVRCSIELVLDTAMKVFGASSGSFLMLNDEGQVTEAALAYGGQVDFKPVSQLSDVSTRGLAGWVLENRQAALIQSTREDPRWLPRMWESLGGISRSAVSVPFITNGRVAGVLTLVHSKEGMFTKEDLMLLTTISVFLSVNAARNMKVKS
jgi:D-sedoheptulose 7-phosphate isomerase